MHHPLLFFLSDPHVSGQMVQASAEKRRLPSPIYAAGTGVICHTAPTFMNTIKALTSSLRFHRRRRMYFPSDESKLYLKSFIVSPVTCSYITIKTSDQFVKKMRYKDRREGERYKIDFLWNSDSSFFFFFLLWRLFWRQTWFRIFSCCNSSRDGAGVGLFPDLNGS